MNRNQKTSKELLNSKYTTLCQALGDSILKQEQLQAHIDSIKDQIKVLNSAFPILEELEASQTNKNPSNLHPTDKTHTNTP